MRSQRSVLRPIKVAVALVVGTLLAAVPVVSASAQQAPFDAAFARGRPSVVADEVLVKFGPAPRQAQQRRPTDRQAFRSCGRCPGWM